MVVVLPSPGFTQSEQVIFGSVPYKFSKLSNNVCHQHADGKKEQKIRHSWNTAFDVHSMKQNSILNWKKKKNTHTHTKYPLCNISKIPKNNRNQCSVRPHNSRGYWSWNNLYCYSPGPRSADSRKATDSYWRKYALSVLVNRLWGLSRNSLSRLTGRLEWPQ